MAERTYAIAKAPLPADAPTDERGREIQRQWLRAKWNYEADQIEKWERRQREHDG